MEFPLVPWVLLILGLSLSSAHYIHHRQAEDDSNVYEVHDGSADINFVNPKPEKPTLREILYYHVIERARDEDQSPITERSFTNSHGYQFLEPSLENEIGLTKTRDDVDDERYVHEDEDGELLDYDDETHDAEVIQEPVSTTTQKPLTDEDVKEAYKARHYLFDQMRQRYAVKRMAESLRRKKRQAEMESMPDTPGLASDTSDKDAYIQPKTYGMNLNSDGGYVWNNLNNPPTYYELGPSNGNPAEGQSGTTQSQEFIPPSENTDAPPTTEDLEDIFVGPNTEPSAERPDENKPTNESPEQSYENPAPSNENPEAAYENPEPVNYTPVPVYENSEHAYGSPENLEPIVENPEPADSEAYPVEPVIAGDEGVADYPMGPEVYNPEPSSEEPTGNSEPIDSAQESEMPHESPISEVQSTGSSFGPEKTQSESSSESNYDGEKLLEMPEAPTLPPLNYDNLPGYIRDAISSTEKQASYEDTENSYFNPQMNPEDKKELEDKMENIFATMPSVEDIPKTYGMNLTSEGGHVWNGLVNPPVSYDVGSPSKSEEGPKEPEKVEIIEEPVTIPEPDQGQPETYEGEGTKPIEEAEKPAEPEKEPIANLDDTDQGQPEIVEGEGLNPIEEAGKPAEPEKEDTPADKPNTYGMSLSSDGGHVWNDLVNPPVSYDVGSPSKSEEEHTEPETVEEVEEPIANPDEPSQEQPEPHESEEANPIEEPAEPEKDTVEQENPEIPPEPASQPDFQTPEEDKPIEEPVEPKPEEPENPEVSEEEKKPADLKPDIMSELLKSEQFWKWLGEWTATYMELIEKHTRKIAIQEICNYQKSGNQMCLLDDNIDNSSDTGVIIKDGKIIVDGKEIDITYSSNLKDGLRRGSQCQNNNKGTNGNKVEASTIYGNSIGNEKVTNVFIFSADKADEVIDKLKPSEDSGNDFLLDERVKEEEKIENSEAEANKQEPNENDAGKDETNKGVANIEESGEVEASTEMNGGEENKEQSNEGEANEEVANIEELSESGAIKEEANESEANMEASSEGEAIKEEGKEVEVNEEESNEGETNEKVAGEASKEEHNEDDASKEIANEGESKMEESKKKYEKLEAEEFLQ